MIGALAVGAFAVGAWAVKALGPLFLVIGALAVGAFAVGAWGGVGLLVSIEHVWPTYSNGLVGSIKAQEGFRGQPYDDTRGDATLGYGTKLPITEAEGTWLLETRLADTHARLAKAWAPYGGLNKARQGALLDMAYEVGVDGLLGFHDMLAALERGDWKGASAAALDSLWAEEVPHRAKFLAAILGDG